MRHAYAEKVHGSGNAENEGLQIIPDIEQRSQKNCEIDLLDHVKKQTEKKKLINNTVHNIKYINEIIMPPLSRKFE